MSHSRRDTVSQALRKAWSPQLQKIHACEYAVLAGSDAIEALHQLRVALRTTRALLRLFRDYLPDSEALASELAWLSGALNRARDLDIVAAFLQRSSEDVSASDQKKFNALLRALESQRDEQRFKLQKLLHTRRYHRLLKEWRNFIEIRLCDEDIPNTSNIPFGSAWRVVALGQILGVLRELRRLGDAAKPAELHRLRIRCKRLRYLLEAKPDSGRKQITVAALVKSLVRLQNILGQSQDVVVIRSWLVQVEQKKNSSLRVPAGCYVAAERQRQKMSAALPNAWRAFVKSAGGI
ncbi:MAG TPA: CHAD domain-containing protein [Spongiibacteraceae bacterium]|nr:CHAD domain-containing protein [Spongiibacteraceae bacterium]